MKTQRNRAVGCSAWLDVLVGITLMLPKSIYWWLRSPTSRARTNGFEALDLLLQIGILRLKFFALRRRALQLRFKFNKALLENRKLLTEKRNVLRLNRGGAVLFDEPFKRCEKISDLHTSNEKEISHGRVSWQTL